MRRTKMKKPDSKRDYEENIYEKTSNPKREYEENKYENTPNPKREYESTMGKWGFQAKTSEWQV